MGEIVKYMNRDEVLNLISEAIQPNPEEEQDSDSAIIRAIVLRSPINLAGHKVENYHINFDSIEILDTFSVDGDANYTDITECAIVTFDKGMALITHTLSADYTFSTEEFLLDIVETDDWDTFDRVCLTDGTRERFINFIAEIKLLRN